MYQDTQTQNFLSTRFVSAKIKEIKTNLNADLSEVLANQFHMTSVIVNILDNAIKYSPETPTIVVSTENTPKSILLKVKDQGMGMD